MKFITVRDLRLKPGEVWKLVKKEKDLVITTNGRPVAILTGTNEDTLQQELDAIQRARALVALERIQKKSVEKGTDSISRKEIDFEIRTVRRGKKS